MTDYMIEKQDFGSVEIIFDIQAFARDLAAVMGGAYVTPAKDDMSAAERYATFTLDGYDISLSRDWSDRRNKTVHVSIRMIGDKLGHLESDGYRMPKASVSGTRPLAALAKDIRRRVIEPAAAPAAKRRELTESRTQYANNLAAHAKRMRAAFPGLQVDVSDSAASLYLNSDGNYLTGRLDGDGKVTIDRISQLNAAAFAGVMAALALNK
jgi:hypothetical protein